MTIIQFSMSAVAFRHSRNDRRSSAMPEFSNMAMSCAAPSSDAAREVGMAEAVRLYPEKEGWYGHSISVCEIDTAAFLAAKAELETEAEVAE